MGVVLVLRALVLGLAGALLLASPAAAAGSADLANAAKALKAGKTEAVIKGLTAALGRLSGADAAKAFLLRGTAHAKSEQHVQAISDLNMALWLKGLSPEQQSEAQRLRQAAFAALGQSDPGSSGPAPAAVATPSEPAADPGAGDGQWGTTLSASGAAGEGATAPKVKSKPKAKTEPAAVAQASGETLPWLTDTAAAPAPTETGNWQQTAVLAEAPASGASGYFVQVGSVRTPGEAEAIAAKVSAEHADTLAGLAPLVAPASLGNMGTFYLVQLGPLPDERSSLKLCKQLQRKGVDCFIVQR